MGWAQGVAEKWNQETAIFVLFLPSAFRHYCFPPYKLSYPIGRSFPGQLHLLNELIFSYKTPRYCKLTF